MVCISRCLYNSFSQLLDYLGMSESSGPQSTNVMSEGRWKVGSVGPVIKDVKLKIDKPEQNGDGEVCKFI